MQKVIQIQNYDWLHDGVNREQSISFYSDGTLERSNGDKGIWKVQSLNRLVANFGVGDHIMLFNKDYTEAEIAIPVRSPSSMIK